MDIISFISNKLDSLSLDDYEIYQVVSHLFSAQAKEGEIELTQESIEHGVAIRLFKGGRCGFGCSSDFELPFLERMLDLAYTSLSILGGEIRCPLPLGKEGDEKKRSFENGGNGALQSIQDKQAKFDLALALERKAKEFDSRIRRVRDAGSLEARV